jgi:hypothetical protein
MQMRDLPMCDAFANYCINLELKRFETIAKTPKRLLKDNLGVFLQPPSPPAPLPQAGEGSNI